MGKEYKIKRQELEDYDFKEPVSENVWAEIPSLKIEYYPWDRNSYRPEVEVKLFYTETRFHIRFKVWEKKIRAVYRNLNDDVYKDSCVEFFFKPNPVEDERYFNFEINALGTPLIGLGSERKNRIRINNIDVSIFNIFTSVNLENIKDYEGEFWSIEYSIPFTFIEKYFDHVNMEKVTGNFYKCGDETECPHFGCWNLIDLASPDFHRPEYFGNIILEN